MRALGFDFTNSLYPTGGFLSGGMMQPKCRVGEMAIKQFLWNGMRLKELKKKDNHTGIEVLCG